MGDSESEMLNARLTGIVGDRPADEFYQEFNLVRPTVFAEFYFKEMMQIYHLPGMETWPETMKRHGTTNNHGSRPPPKCYMSMVCFRPPGADSFKAAPGSIKRKVKLAHSKAREMILSCFETKEDHKCIKVAMDNYPSIAIFMCPVVDPKQEMKRQRGNNKMIKFAKAFLM